MITKNGKAKGRPADGFAMARAKIKELRGQAKQLETIAKKMRLEAEQINNEIKLQKPKLPKRDDSTFLDFKSSVNGAVVKVFTKEDIDNRTNTALNSLFDDDGAEHLFDDK